MQKLSGGHAMRIDECVACGALHESVDVRELATPPATATHWYQCPTTGDPVTLALYYHDDRLVHIPTRAFQSLLESTGNKSWCIAFCHITSEGKTRCVVHKNDYPHDRFVETWQLCKELLEDELRKAGRTVEEMPRAKPSPMQLPPGLRNLRLKRPDDDEGRREPDEGASPTQNGPSAN